MGSGLSVAFYDTLFKNKLLIVEIVTCPVAAEGNKSA